MPNRRVVILSIQTALSLVICAGLVAFCYLLVDRPVALWIHDHFGWNLDWLKWPDIIFVLMITAPLALILAGIKRLWGPWRRWEALMVTIACSVFAMTALKQLLKWIFGRPNTKLWLENVGFTGGNDNYAFHWFHGFWPYGAFPSGHSTIACAIATIVWIVWPKWRWLAVIALLTIAFCLVITNAHFVGDIVAGSFLGWLGGLWTVQFMPPAIRPNVTPAKNIVPGKKNL